ncbi:hypothetical protein [Novosphingobium jiangmenense]|uniref:Uncharacterized protein n=1 Tax=Novosphingobium jiangmenense TaxID=2791981 RepID=A0ABS0HAZ1_9SPHN|nr:hypothetical protein [Novosphingobium jiangmenense]MBF9149449.1 hypothetical protein [Novosphingobium jiangmenense]
MSFAEALAGAGAKPAGKRPYFLEPQVERVLAITMAMAQELAVARQRSDTLERLLLAKGVLTPGEIDAFVPDRAASAERQMWNQEFIARILRIVQQENEAVMSPAEVASGDVGEELAREA